MIFNEFSDLEVQEDLTHPQKMTEKEYLDLLTYQWKQRTKRSKIIVEIEADKEHKRVIYRVFKKPTTAKQGKKLVKGERSVKPKKS